MFSILVKHSEEYFDNTNNAIIVYTTYKLFNLLTLYKKEIVTTSYEKISRFLPSKEDDMKFVGFKEMMKGDYEHLIKTFDLYLGDHFDLVR